MIYLLRFSSSLVFYSVSKQQNETRLVFLVLEQWKSHHSAGLLDRRSTYLKLADLLKNWFFITFFAGQLVWQDWPQYLFIAPSDNHFAYGPLFQPFWNAQGLTLITLLNCYMFLYFRRVETSLLLTSPITELGPLISKLF